MAVPLTTPDSEARELEDLELQLLTEAIHQRYGYDFRGYARASLRRLFWRRVHLEGLRSLSGLQERVLHDPACMERLLGDLSINYRLQVLVEGAGIPAFSPRISLIVPSGNASKGLGNGNLGWQVNLPFSKQFRDLYAEFGKAGADVYVQKPISVDVAEGRAMLAAARKHKRVVQVGTQRRSTPHLIDAKKKVIDGGPYTAKKAAALGLIDRLDYTDGFEKFMETDLKAKSFKVVRDYGMNERAEAPEDSRRVHSEAR